MLHVAVKEGRPPSYPRIGVDLSRLTAERRGCLFPDELDAVALRPDEAVRRAGVYGTGTDTPPTLLDDQSEVASHAV